jgi:hypothetical protein
MTVVFVLGCIVWLSLTVFYMSLTTKPARSSVRRGNKRTLQSAYSFEEFDGYDVLYANVYDRNDVVDDASHRGFWLLGVGEITGSLVKESALPAEDKLSGDELAAIFAMLYKNNVFITDLTMLNELQLVKKKGRAVREQPPKNVSAVTRVKTMRKVSAYLNDEFEPGSKFIYMSFGASDLNLLKRLDRDMLYNMNSKCKYRQASTNFSDVEEKYALSSMYIICYKLVIQIAVFYTRGHFYWIGVDRFYKGKEKVFGDTNRAMNKYCLLFI